METSKEANLKKSIDTEKSLMIFTFDKLKAVEGKGNLDFIRNYEYHFEKVYCIYLVGEKKTKAIGNTEFISLGTKHTFFDIIYSPIRLLGIFKNKKPKVLLSADIIFSWWATMFVKVFMRQKIFVMPVCLPHVIWKTSNRTITGILPRWLEKIFIYFSFKNANTVVTSKSFGAYVNWLESKPYIKEKLRVAQTSCIEIPSRAFFDNLDIVVQRQNDTLLYVGRLHPEKLVIDLLIMLKCLKDGGENVKLWLIGEGSEKKRLQDYAKEHKLDVVFYGRIPLEELPKFYKQATIFVSPLTGSSLREAAICKTPIVAYDIDWVSSFKSGEKLLLAKKDPKDLAKKVKELLDDKVLQKKLIDEMNIFVNKNWTVDAIRSEAKIYE